MQARAYKPRQPPERSRCALCSLKGHNIQLPCVCCRRNIEWYSVFRRHGCFSVQQRSSFIEAYVKDGDGNWKYNIEDFEEQFVSCFPDYVITENFRRNLNNLVSKFRETECTERKRELRDIYKDPDIIALIKSGRLRWLGHVLRRDEDSLLRKAFDYSPRCTRPLGSPRLRWQDQVYDHLCAVEGRQEDAEDRDEWRYIVNEAKNHLGFEIP
ncbi:hypothetical protein ANN_24342 [Periplaneta americana]|uniref:Uncharacterized protein n=1 Tax=Periplaneta americana TaxID=6978 RepID=A0ABQ8S2T5_PERAM|nr:hypothetical protein ANN_24342 [Periplaneta americana]